MVTGNVVVLTMLVALLAGNCLPIGDAIWLNLTATGPRCISEEIQNDIVVLADYMAITDSKYHPSLTIAAKVTSPFGNILYLNENHTSGTFAFTTHESGNYLACFWVDDPSHGSHEVSVNLDWKIGINARNWDSVARKEKIDGVALELKKLEGAVESIHENIIHLKTREEELMMVSESTNSKVAWFSIMSLGICVTVSILQLWHLRVYFQKKKLI